MIRKLLCWLGWHEWYDERMCETCKYRGSLYGCFVFSKDCTNKRKRCKHCGKVKK